jgi:hypothetical protein
MAVTDIDPQWSMPSNSGWYEMRCSARPRSARRGIVPCELSIEGRFWQRDRALSSASLTQDFHVALPQIMIDVSALETLHDLLVEWQGNWRRVEVELGVPAGDPRISEMEAAAGDQRLSVLIGESPELISSAQKPVCTIRYDNGPRMSGQCSFVVDQSCIRICSEGLREFIGRVAPS